VRQAARRRTSCRVRSEQKSVMLYDSSEKKGESGRLVVVFWAYVELTLVKSDLTSASFTTFHYPVHASLHAFHSGLAGIGVWR